MTLKDIAEKALAKAGEVLDNPGNWTGANTSKLSAEAVQTLLTLSLTASGPSSRKPNPPAEVTEPDPQTGPGGPQPPEEKPKRGKKSDKEETEPAAAE